ncbi:19134_t:CDS:2 [Entrophospora sp. SA101]|nr:19134_t:CDS:2 [Entrophospora sp. SA101]
MDSEINVANKLPSSNMKLEDKFDSLQNEISEMKKTDADISNRITNIEKDLKELIKLMKSKQA